MINLSTLVSITDDAGLAEYMKFTLHKTKAATICELLCEQGNRSVVFNETERRESISSQSCSAPNYSRVAGQMH